MVNHVSLRLAWHNDGWNGRICKEPGKNTYCVGSNSYPGDLIAETRDLAWETQHRGEHCLDLYHKEGKIPPCCFSINAFGEKEIWAKVNPPEFFNDDTQPRIWKLDSNTATIWPYEQMYEDDVKNEDGTLNYEKRLEASREYFSSIEPEKSLIFYYSNLSNPFSEDDKKRYVIIGISRLKELGKEAFYEGCSEKVIKKYAGGFIWQREFTSSYPEEGFLIPYYKYMDNKDLLEKIVLYPENPRNFKYGTRQISDDDALVIVEQLIELVKNLINIKDETENWNERLNWLNSLVAELWKSRGLFPGLLKVLDAIGFQEIIEPYKNKLINDPKKEVEFKNELFSFLKGNIDKISDIDMDDSKRKIMIRRWNLRSDEEKELLENVLVRFDLTSDQIGRIKSDKREQWNIYSTIKQLNDNPYILCEEYLGDDLDDFISFNKIDHGIFPSPNYSDMAYNKFELDDAKRLRALCVSQLRVENQHVFQLVNRILNKINGKLSHFPEWKQWQFNLKYFDVDRDILQEKLAFRTDEQDLLYVYLKKNYDYERLIENTIRNLSKRSDIEIKKPLTQEHWKNFLYDSESPILKSDPKKYNDILEEQAEICSRLFSKPISIISGEAGTGKTTLINAILKGVKKNEGEGAYIQLLAPTGKAADRIRDITKYEALTIHSFLARLHWLNKNFSFKMNGGEQETISTLIIDEASMLDLALVGTLFKAISWPSIRRLVFVGDPNQLPPIGCGKFFSDLIDWFKETNPENLGVLKTNIRQLKNTIEHKGTGILELASLYARKEKIDVKDYEFKYNTENIMKKIQEGNDIDKDLRVIYWSDYEDLQNKLINTLLGDLKSDVDPSLNLTEPTSLWAEAFKIHSPEQRPDYLQIISPYKGEFYGVENINFWVQNYFNEHAKKNGLNKGITFYDKVIQIRNRTRSNPIKAWNTKTRTLDEIEVFNGQIGFTKPHAFDEWKWKITGFRPSRLQVTFKQKQSLWVEYNSGKQLEENLELAYAISVHKAQGSEFTRVYFVLPKSRKSLLTTELFYTGITRAMSHSTLFIEEDHSPLLTLLRPENSQINRINSSLFVFKPVPEEYLDLSDWYEEGKIHRILTGKMVRSKSEVIIANMLHEKGIPFKYEVPLYANDGTFYLPDFTITWGGENWYWEHLGLLNNEKYKRHWETKLAWYKEKNFIKKLITTDEKSGIDSLKIKELIDKFFPNNF